MSFCRAAHLCLPGLLTLTPIARLLTPPKTDTTYLLAVFLYLVPSPNDLDDDDKRETTGEHTREVGAYVLRVIPGSLLCSFELRIERLRVVLPERQSAAGQSMPRMHVPGQSIHAARGGRVHADRGGQVGDGGGKGERLGAGQRMRVWAEAGRRAPLAFDRGAPLG